MPVQFEFGDKRAPHGVSLKKVLNTTSGSAELLTVERLFGWRAAMFPIGYFGMSRIATGQWRDNADGPMQLAPGAVGRRKVHYRAPPADVLPAEAAKFLAWAN